MRRQCFGLEPGRLLKNGAGIGRLFIILGNTNSLAPLNLNILQLACLLHLQLGIPVPYVQFFFCHTERTKRQRMHIELYKVASTLSRVETVTLIIRCLRWKIKPLLLSDIKADF